MTLDTLPLEQIREITDRAFQEGWIPLPDACDGYGQPLLMLAALAALFRLTSKQGSAHETEIKAR